MDLLNDSESDSDYKPDIDTTEAEAKIETVDLDHAKEILKEIKKEIKSEPIIIKKETSLEEAMKVAKAIQENKNNNNNVKVNFAGEDIDFTIGKRNRTSIDQLLSETKKKKSINSLTKSSLDWEKYKQENKLEDSLSRNRKDGYIAKANFLLASKEKEKEQLLSLKRKKFN